MSDVIIKKASYDYETLKPVIYQMLESLGAGSIQSGTHVLIKPNLLIPASPEKGIVVKRGWTTMRHISLPYTSITRRQ